MESYRQPTSESKRTALTRAAGSVVLFAILAGCTSERDTTEPRNAPPNAEYTIDASLPYYQDIQNISKHTKDPEILTKLDELANTPVAQWLYGDEADVHIALQSTLTASKESGTVPLLVAYNIPNRDLNNWSGGGSSSATDYINWIKGISQTIDDQPAIVIVEPDALPHALEMNEQQTNERLELLATALDTLHDNKNTAAYIDIGNSTWLSPEEAAGLLKKVAEKTQHGIHGISLNVSNYISEDDTRAYAEKIQNAYGKELFVMIDNSRNGQPDAVAPGEWCNPAKQKLGTIDPAYDADTKIEEAFIKAPGQSDGICGISSAPAGEFDGELLFRQIKGQ